MRIPSVFRTACLVLAASMTACSAGGAPPEATSAPADLQATDAVVGTGEVARRPRCVYAHYTVWLEDGTRVESSLDPGTDGRPGAPVAFPLGARAVIRGWDQGFEGMRVGGVRRLVVPYQLAYGTRGRPPGIPPRANLTFDVQLLAVADPLPRRASATGTTSTSRPPECPGWATVSRK